MLDHAVTAGGGRAADHVGVQIAREVVEEIDRLVLASTDPVAMLKVSILSVATACKGTLGQKPATINPARSPSPSHTNALVFRKFQDMTHLHSFDFSIQALLG